MQGEGVYNGANYPSDNLSLPRSGTVGDKRRLLLIYIHGFMGSEASFLDFPAHVHDLLTALLSDSHVVYTRIYPRYKSHGEIQTAVAQFSAWLSPHEADDLDVVLLGHSLGGILAADVALLQRHQILGLVNFDVPFLGLHPRVVPTGILSSMPRKDIAPEEKLADEQESLGMEPAYKPAAPDPNFDRPWRNDIRLPNRGFFKGVMHFVNKNTDNLARSIVDRVVSSAKFAGCVNNYSELRRRYRDLMELEAAEYNPKTVRFVNYYTASTGRKKPKKEEEPKEGSIEGSVEEDSKETKEEEINQDDSRTPTPTPTSPTPALQESLESLSISKEMEPETASTSSSTSSSKSPITQTPSSSNTTLMDTHSGQTPEPTIPTTPSRSTTSNSNELREASLHLSESTSTSESATSTSTSASEQKLRKFILLPKNHWKYHDNAHWTAVVMQDIDEVEAHQSMFIPGGAHYEHLVGDTVSLIETWTQNAMSRRVVQESLD